MNSIRPWISAARPKTLFATLAPIIVGISLSYKISNTIDWCLTSLIMLSAVLLQIGSNYANDAYDYLKGADSLSIVPLLKLLAKYSPYLLATAPNGGKGSSLLTAASPKAKKYLWGSLLSSEIGL